MLLEKHLKYLKPALRYIHTCQQSSNPSRDPPRPFFSTLSVNSWKMPSPILSHFWDHLPYRTSRLEEPPLPCPTWGFNVPNLMGIKRRMIDIGNWKCTDFPAFAFKVCKKCYYDFHKCWFQIRWCRLKKIPLKRLCQFWVFLYLHIFSLFFANNQNLQNVILWLNQNFSWKNNNMGIKKRRILCWFQIRWCRLKKMILKKLWKFFVFAHFFFEHFWKPAFNDLNKKHKILRYFIPILTFCPTNTP